MKVIDKYGFPIETFKGKYIKNFIRKVIHGNVTNTFIYWFTK